MPKSGAMTSRPGKGSELWRIVTGLLLLWSRHRLPGPTGQPPVRMEGASITQP